MIRRASILLCMLLLLVYCSRSESTAGLSAPLRQVDVPTGWWRGNTHTHTLWSDGKGSPDWVTRWYKESGYDFLVLSDHNIMQEGEKWVRVPEAYAAELRKLFGDKVQTRGEELRLATLSELRERFQDPQFLLMAGEELTDHFEGSVPVHVNGLNLAETIPPQGGSSVREMLNRNVDAVVDQGKRLKRPVLAHVNHPNYKWAVTWEDLAHLKNDRFFEVYNGHHLAGNGGAPGHPGTEEMWDRANTLRLTSLKLPPLFAMATDDSHDYSNWGVGNRNPGRGWVVVRAPRLETGEILKAMHAGDYYASTGVVLEDFRLEKGVYRVKVRADAGVSYRVRFNGRDGRVLAERDGPLAEYTLKGDELYVRATVTSSRPHPNASVAGDFEQAWLQPVQVAELGPGKTSRK